MGVRRRGLRGGQASAAVHGERPEAVPGAVCNARSTSRDPAEACALVAKVVAAEHDRTETDGPATVAHWAQLDELIAQGFANKNATPLPADIALAVDKARSISKGY